MRGSGRLPRRWSSRVGTVSTALSRSMAEACLEEIGGEAVCQFALDRFDELFHDDHQEWCSLIEACPDARALRLIEPQLGRGQPVIDECYYLLRMLADEDSADLETVRQRVWRRSRACSRSSGEFRSRQFRRVVQDPESGPALRKVWRRQSIRNQSHGGWQERLPRRAFRSRRFAVRVVRPVGGFRTHARRPDAYDGGSACPLSPARIKATVWRAKSCSSSSMFITDGGADRRRRLWPSCKAAVNDHPDSIVNHLRLARMQHVFERRGRAEECYRSALRLEPNSMEAGLGLARILSDAGQQRQAFGKLRQMLEAQGDWRFFRTDELSPKMLADEFTSLFNKLHAALDVRDSPLLHATALEGRRKIGRNDPCPCGSGAKYKKCCGGPRSAAPH